MACHAPMMQADGSPIPVVVRFGRGDADMKTPEPERFRSEPSSAA